MTIKELLTYRENIVIEINQVKHHEELLFAKLEVIDVLIDKEEENNKKCIFD